MDSVPLKDIRRVVEAYDHQLCADDPRFQREVILIHEDGSFLRYTSAFLVRIREVWIVAFTEHHGYHIYHQDDLLLCQESVRIPGGIEELPHGP